MRLNEGRHVGPDIWSKLNTFPFVFFKYFFGLKYESDAIGKEENPMPIARNFLDSIPIDFGITSTAIFARTYVSRSLVCFSLIRLKMVWF